MPQRADTSAYVKPAASRDAKGADEVQEFVGWEK
jgi:hypothetical protein